MNILVSPYHLTTRELPAMVACSLASRAITMLPAGCMSLESPSPALKSSALFREVLRAWQWTSPLWQAGVLSSEDQGRAVTPDVAKASAHLRDEPALAPLRAFLQDVPAWDDAAREPALWSDLLRGGPNPALSLPVTAGLDRYAALHALCVARPPASSVAERAEASLGEQVCVCAVPIFVQACAERVLVYRRVLARELAMLHRALRAATATCSTAAHAAQGDHEAAQAFTDACANLASAFEGSRDELLADAKHDDVRAVEGLVRISVRRLPWDAVYQSSLRAVRTMEAPARAAHKHTRESINAAPSHETQTTALATRDEATGTTFIGLSCQAVGSAARR